MTRTRPLTVSLAFAACLAAGVPSAGAQQGDPAAAFPNRPIRVVVPFTPGGQPDVFSRLVADMVSRALGQQIIVDNRPGAGGMVGSRIVAEANPDGYTLLSISAAHTIGPAVRKVPYNTVKDFAGVTMMYNGAYILVVPPKVAQSTKELIELAKSRPGQLNMASAGRGSGTHFAGEVFKHAAGIDVEHVPYKGIPEAMNDIIAGRVQLFMAPLATSVPLIRDGRIRALGVTSLKRVSAVPDVPTIAESGLPGFRWDSWGALFAPSRTPRGIIDRLNREFTTALKHPDVMSKMRSMGAEPSPTTPKELDHFVAKDLETVRKIANIAGIKPQ